MKLFRRISALILAVLMIFLCACGPKDQPDTPETDGGNNTFSLVENGRSDYVIVVPKGDSALYQKAYTLSEAIESVTGVRLQVLQDSYAEQEKEILVGNTSRKVDAEQLNSLATPDDYAVLKNGDKVLIYGCTESSVDGAVAYFTENYITPVKDGVLRVPENMNYVFLSDAEYMVLAADGVSEYVIVSRESDKKYAQTVQDAVKKQTGITLNIVTASEKHDREIIVGDAQRDEGKAVEDNITSAFEGVFKAVGKKLVIAAGGDAALDAAVKYFEKTAGNLMFNGKMMVSSVYEKKVSFGEQIAEQVLESIRINPSSIDMNVEVEEVRVYTPDGSDGAWYYSHHPFMTKFNDRYYIFYSSGRRNEDDCGQRIMMATSDDFVNWDVSVLVDSIQGKYAEWVLYCKGCYVRDGVMTVYYHGYEYAEDVLRKNSDGTALRPLEENAVRLQYGTYYIQTTDGKNWSAPKELGAIKGGNMSPIEYDGGVLLWAGYGSLSVSGSLSGTENWNNIGLKLDANTKEPKAITESSIYQLSDGTLIIMSRTNGGCMLAAASFDGGKSWTDMYETKFTDYAAKFQFGTLPDGRYYYVGNLSTKRSELVVMISDNGVDFTEGYYLGDTEYKQQRQGMYKGGLGFAFACKGALSAGMR
ncbi:MAG: exo-alpha-sialidase, partial [Eubacteriales bacterium]